MYMSLCPIFTYVKTTIEILPLPKSEDTLSAVATPLSYKGDISWRW